MNNPGIDVAIWERLKTKWAQWEKNGYSLRVDFKVIKDSNNAGKPLAIDVIQKINNDFRVETVQHSSGEAYLVLGIVGFSMEELIQTYKTMLRELYRRVEKEEADLVVEMIPVSITSGETMVYLQQLDTELKSSVLLNYQHYYVLNALREKMIELSGDRWSRVKAVYHAGDVEFYFDYQDN